MPKATTIIILLSVLLSSSACSSYKDDEQKKHDADAIISILSGKVDNYRPNNIIYIENPKNRPSISTRLVAGSTQDQLDKIFRLNTLFKGFTVACAQDTEKNTVLIALNHNGTYTSYGVFQKNSPEAILCMIRGKQ